MLDGYATNHDEAVDWVQCSVHFEELLGQVEIAWGQEIYHANGTYVRTVCNDCMNDATALPMCACVRDPPSTGSRQPAFSWVSRSCGCCLIASFTSLSITQSHSEELILYRDLHQPMVGNTVHAVTVWTIKQTQNRVANVRHTAATLDPTSTLGEVLLTVIVSSSVSTDFHMLPMPYR